MGKPLAAKGNPFKSVNAVHSATFTAGVEGSNARNVVVQLLDSRLKNVAERVSIIGYLSLEANGDAILASAPSGGVVIGTDGLAIPLVAGKAFLFTCETTGKFDITITEATALTFYIHLVMPDGTLVHSGAIAFA